MSPLPIKHRRWKMKVHEVPVADIYDPEFELWYLIIKSMLATATEEDILEGIATIRRYREWISEETIEILRQWILRQIFDEMEFDDPFLMDAVNRLLELIGLPERIDLNPL